MVHLIALKDSKVSESEIHMAGFEHINLRREL